MAFQIRSSTFIAVCLAGTTAALLLDAHSDDAPGTPFSRELNESMMRMDQAMEKAGNAFTGDPDSDFIRMMIPHHQGAIDMAKSVVVHGADPALRSIAQEIIAEQNIEIAYMQKIAERLDAAKARPGDFAPPVSSLGRGGSNYRLVDNEGGRRAPENAPAAVYANDRIYTGDQVSNTVSVIDPAENKLLGLIKLGELPPASLLPLYKGQSLVHGLGFSPDGRRLCVVSIGSNSLSLIDTATNKVLKTAYLGRSPHEAFFTPDGREIYAAVRGEDYVSVRDAETLTEIARIQTNAGPAMILFRPDGKYAFVPSSFTPELCVIDTATRAVVARVPQASPFSPNLAVSADGQQVWFTLKDSGKTQVMSAAPPFAILGTIASGPITNHVTCVDNANGRFAYVTVGGSDEVKVYRREPPFQQVATVPTGALPHGIWGSPDGNRIYIGLENEAKVQAIDTLSNQVIATVPIGQLPQALVYVPRAAQGTDGNENLLPLSALKESKAYTLVAADEKQGGRATVTVISLGLIDQIQIAASGLVPGEQYTLFLQETSGKPARREPLVTMKAGVAGTLIADTLGPLPGLVSPGAANQSEKGVWKFSLEAEGSKAALSLVQH